MSKFTKSGFSSGEYITYNGRFIARLKRGGRASFLTFLVKNFTVEEYLSRLDAGEAPLKILESKGYLLPHVEQMLEVAGFEVSVAGMQAYIQNQIDARYART